MAASLSTPSAPNSLQVPLLAKQGPSENMERAGRPDFLTGWCQDGPDTEEKTARPVDGADAVRVAIAEPAVGVGVGGTGRVGLSKADGVAPAGSVVRLHAREENYVVRFLSSQEGHFFLASVGVGFLGLVVGVFREQELAGLGFGALVGQTLAYATDAVKSRFWGSARAREVRTDDPVLVAALTHPLSRIVFYGAHGLMTGIAIGTPGGAGGTFTGGGAGAGLGVFFGLVKEGVRTDCWTGRFADPMSVAQEPQSKSKPKSTAAKPAKGSRKK